jgi:hypothetical protein
MASFATSYIPTLASQVTRTADVATITGANFSQWYNQSEGTFVVEAASASASQDGKFLSLTDGTASGQNNSITLDVGSSGKTRFFVTTSGTVQAVFVSSATYTPNSVIKIAGAYKQNDFGGTTKGEAITTDTTGSVPSVSVMEIGYHRYGLPLQWVNGHIRSVRYYPTRLQNSQLQALTA